jgi:hypothetical protein
MPRFKIIEKAENVTESVIETVIPKEVKTFTLGEVDNNIAMLEKKHKEALAQIQYEDAVISNITGHNPFTKDLTDEQMHAVSMLYASKSTRDAAQSLVEKIKPVLEKEKEDHATICKLLGVTPAVITKANEQTAS